MIGSRLKRSRHAQSDLHPNGTLLVLAALIGCGSSDQESASPDGELTAPSPSISPEDLANLGPSDQFLFWPPEQQVAGYRNIDRIFDTRTIRTGDGQDPTPLSAAGPAVFEVR